MSPRRLGLVGLLLIVALALVGGSLASSRPDGLEYVAEQLGLASGPHQHPPGTPPHRHGIASSGVARVVGTLVVLGLAGGMFWVLRRRTPDSGGGRSDDRAGV